MPVCSVGWCACLATDGSSTCAVHRKFPDYRPDGDDSPATADQTTTKFSALLKELGAEETDCPACDGRGQVTVEAEAECGLCDGSGHMSAENIDELIDEMQGNLAKAVARRKSLKAARQVRRSA